MYYVYFLKSKNTNWFYTGYTSNLKKRLIEHNSGRSPATRPHMPFGLIFYEAYKSRLDAKRREKYFKTNQGKRLLKIMLKNSLKS
ncbi:MAG TPA: GIY-YIG nuclease family protein [Patescibacteria group bacterium]|nr:GIY-YIG nuclease family protein [Patescibacteria group bacterium]